MMTPFDQKSRLGGAVDHLMLRLVMLVLCFLWFYRLWGMTIPALLAGGALCVLLWHTVTLWQRRTLARKAAALRAHIGGSLAVEALLTAKPVRAARQVADWLAAEHALAVTDEAGDGVILRYEQESLYLLCLQVHPQQKVDASAVLAANRTRPDEPQTDRCILCATGGFTPEALQTAESLDPPVRLIDGDALRALAGRLAPATDEQLVSMGKRMRKPFSWSSLRHLVFSPQKTRRYAAYGTGLLSLFILTNHIYYLIPAGLCWMLAMMSQHRKSRPMKL